MKIEHVALQVPEPGAMADWYVANLGFTVRRGGPGPMDGRFIADGSGKVMLEIYCNPAASVPDYTAMSPFHLHVALTCDDVPAAAERLVAAGATVVSGPEDLGGDQLAMLRDPWGVAIQLVRRKQPMV